MHLTHSFGNVIYMYIKLTKLQSSELPGSKLEWPVPSCTCAALSPRTPLLFQTLLRLPKQIALDVGFQGVTVVITLLSPALWVFQINIEQKPQLKSSQTPALLLTSLKFQFSRAANHLCVSSTIPKARIAQAWGGFKLSLPHTLTQCPLEWSVSLSMW